MNIDDATEVELPEGSLFQAMFQDQARLAEKYGPLERKNGHYYPDQAPGETNIEDAQFQWWIKDMAWRVTEELAESMEHASAGTVPLDGWRHRWADEPMLRHFFEEVADAAHFLVEVTQQVGISWAEAELAFSTKFSLKSLKRDHGYCSVWWIGKVVTQLGLACNRAKNKPWKLTQMATDRGRFLEEFRKVWVEFGAMVAVMDMTVEELYIIYSKKHQVNSFRLGSNY